MRSCVVAAVAPAQQSKQFAHVPGQIIVQERRGADPDAVQLALGRGNARLLTRLNQTRHSVLRVPEAQAEAIMQQLRDTGLFSVVERDGYAQGAATPSDTSFTSQWHLAAIQAAAAWDNTTGNPGQLIAVVDSGIDASHPDLAGRVVAGYNFVNRNTNTQRRSRSRHGRRREP